MLIRTTSHTDTVFRMLQSQVFGQDIARRTSRFIFVHHPKSVYLSLHHITVHVTKPGPSPPLLHAQELDGEKAWERRALLNHDCVTCVKCQCLQVYTRSMHAYDASRRAMHQCVYVHAPMCLCALCIRVGHTEQVSEIVHCWF